MDRCLYPLPTNCKTTTTNLLSMSEKIKHTQLNKSDLPNAIKNTTTFKGFERFKQGLTLKHQNISRIYDYYGQACRHGVDYLRQNPNLFANEVSIIEEIINS